jgi:hypothetical protein
MLGSHGGDYEEYLYSAISYRVVRYKLTDISEEHTAFIFRMASKPIKQQTPSTLRIAGFLDFVRRPGVLNLENTTIQKLNLFPSLGD